jgi:acyl-CoA dehydrogenase
MMEAIIDWFETRGLKRLKKDWHERTWNHDFVDFMAREQVLASLMTPEGYGENSFWNTFRNVDFAEISSFYGITYWYTFQVSMLGLGPIFNGDNEGVKQRAAQLLRQGKVFAFGLSEREHGADIYSSEMRLIPQADGGYLARGGKYYIGNGNEAALVSTFGKIEGTDEYVFFVVESGHERYECVKNTVNAQNYVAEFRLHDYPVSEGDILSRGQKAWDDMLNTINYCKFNLGFGSIGLATHALYESIDHAAGRRLYGRAVTDFPQVRRLLVDSFCRLVGMRLFAYRATDYMRCASPEDRRYLLFNPMVKMKVTTEGEKVVEDLFDVIAAKGFEKEPFFEVAAREIGMLPKLEGTAHVNMALIVKFLENYLFHPAEYPEIPRRTDLADDSFLFRQGPTGGLGKIRFHDYEPVYRRWDLPNIAVFRRQIGSLKRFLLETPPAPEQLTDIDYMLALGELFTLVPYGHLILENAEMEGVDAALINQIFDVFVRDFTSYAAVLYGKPGNDDARRRRIKEMMEAPDFNFSGFDTVWRDHVLPLNGRYLAAP